MNDILHRILEIAMLNNRGGNICCHAQLASIRDIIQAEIKAEAACNNTMLDLEIIGDYKGNLLTRVREKLACWIAP